MLILAAGGLLAQALPALRRKDERARRAFVSRTIRSVCIDELRRRARRPAPAALPPDVADRGPGAVARAASRDDDERLCTEGLPCLSERRRQVLWLRIQDNLSFRDIAELLDIPQAPVASAFSRALARLREILA